MFVSIKSFDEETSAELTKHFGMQIRHGVYFKNSSFIETENIKWRYTPEGLAMREWLNGNISGKYTVETVVVFFEDHDDALLCYLRFKD